MSVGIYVQRCNFSPGFVSQFQCTIICIGDQPLHDPKRRYCRTCSSMYSANFGACPSCYTRGDCENTTCNNMKYYDIDYGEFSYCSPSCRDQHLLPEYNRKLREYLDKDKSLSDNSSTSRVAAVTSSEGSTSTSEVNDKRPSTSKGEYLFVWHFSNVVHYVCRGW